MSYTICLAPGDGIGLEVLPAAQRVLEALALPATYHTVDIGWATFQATGTALPDATLAAIRAANATLFGAVSSPLTRVEGYSSPIVALRRELDLFACVRPVVGTLPDGRPLRLTVVRENTQGMYSGIEERHPDRATTLRVITRSASTRIAAWALDYARHNGFQSITVVHKSNVLRATCGLFREAALEALADGGCVVREMLVDNAAYQLARDPSQFDVIVTTNLFGDILSDIASVWSGGLGLAASANYGPSSAIFEPVHGSAPDIVGQGCANPLATFNAAVLLLEYLNEHERAARLRQAIDAVLANGPRTPDLGGNATTETMTAAVIAALALEIQYEHALS